MKNTKRGLLGLFAAALMVLGVMIGQTSKAQELGLWHVSAFRMSFYSPMIIPPEVIAALNHYQTYDYHQGKLDGFGSVIIVGHPWSNARPAFFLQHDEEGTIARMYWAVSAEGPTWAWDPQRGLRTLPLCPGGCLSTEICLITCPLRRDAV